MHLAALKEISILKKKYLKIYYMSVSYSCVSDSLQSHCYSLQPLCDSLPGLSVHDISQTKILEWVAILFSRGSS